MNWNTNPASKEATERLDIFENRPSNKPLKLSTLDLNPELEKLFEELEISIRTGTRKFTKARTVNFRDFITETLNSYDESDLDVIEVESVEEPSSIKIRDGD